MTIMNTGSVGIGTSTPTDTLDVRGTIVAPLFKGAVNATTMDLMVEQSTELPLVVLHLQLERSRQQLLTVVVMLP